MCPDALLLLFKFFLVSFFLTPHLCWQQHTPAIILAVQNELVYSAALEPKQQVWGLCVKSWEAVRAAFWRSLHPRELCQASLGSFWYRGESCPEEPVQWGLLRTSGEQGERKYLSLSRQKSLGPVSEEPGVFSRVFPLAEVLFGSWEVWLGGSIPAEHTHHTLLKEFH